jgi:hypothetical protein
MPDTTLVGWLGLVAVAACWTLAVVLYRVGTAGSMARKLALLLVFEGITLVTAGFPEFALEVPLEFYDSNMALGIALGVTHWLGDGAMLALYPAFLALALQTPLTRPFAGRSMRIGMWVYGMAAPVAAIIFRAVWNSELGADVLYFSMMLLFVFGFVAAIDAWRRAKPGIARTRAGLFAIAFGIRDVSWGFVYGASFWMTWTNSFSPETALFWQAKLIYALGTLAAVPLIAYGILRGHLLDIDLKIRWTLKQSTFAAAVLVITFVVSEGIEMLVAAELGDKWGLVAAVVALLFLKPLQAFAEKVVSLLMPNTRNTVEYKRSRKVQVYEEAVAEAHAEGGISAKERSLLMRLRDSLGIAESEAEAIERAVIASPVQAH